ncbi:MAG: isoamylase early set domain-containing protein [Micromonosporaceae bacterium]
MIEQRPVDSGAVEVTFRLPATEPAGEVSVVGDFNDWQPGVHHMRLREDGIRAVSVTVPAGTHHFRYLASGGVWCDDEQADTITPYGSTIHCNGADPGSAARQGSPRRDRAAGASAPKRATGRVAAASGTSSGARPRKKSSSKSL